MSFSVYFEVVDDMLRVHSAGDERDAGVAHVCEKPLPILVDEGHAGQINDVLRSGPDLPRVFPAGTQLLNPGAGQPAAERPLLAGLRWGINDSQHIRYAGRGECTPRAAAGPRCAGLASYSEPVT
jgi:hypothetical protein